MKNWKHFIKDALNIPVGAGLSIENLIHYNRLKYGKRYYKKKYSVAEVIDAMKSLGLKEGSVIMVHCSWDEFYNCTFSEDEFIQALLEAIGPSGTLLMPAYPLRRKKPFDVRRTVTGAGLLAETFRKYPGVIRSINVRHSVCGIGPMSDYLLRDHHHGETCWDEMSPFYRLTQVGGLVFALGLGKNWAGTCVHCVEGMLRGVVPYYTDMFDKEKTEYKYIDYDGNLKSYWNYSMPTSGMKMRVPSYIKGFYIAQRYLNGKNTQVSNLQISCFDAKSLVEKLISLGRRGIDGYILPLKFGYKFE